ncbi:hypothetical protein QQ054_04960 [Oscillatoria amoena NRMC-F 0135]|nr:hypothetical protein [Oscillatoria amoena NRMC-F 0135]
MIELISSTDSGVRDSSLESFCQSADLPTLMTASARLEAFRKDSGNLYEKVRALMFQHAIFRYFAPGKITRPTSGLVPYGGYQKLLNRRFEEAITVFRSSLSQNGPDDAIFSALAAAYHGLAFQTLADQVRRSVRGVRGNQWMFRIGHPLDQPLRFRSELLRRDPVNGSLPTLREQTPVRMDLTHSAWSDIFFLGMDFPQGAKVLNVSIDLGVHGRDAAPLPPVEARLRVIDEPVLRLRSVDLGATAEITDIAEVFDFARDYLGLLKAAVIAAGLIPPGIEGSAVSLGELLGRMTSAGCGLEITSNVNSIPKGSRLAVSTNLLAALIAVCMRATGQARNLTGPLSDEERRIVVRRAILGEWLGGSGGGWQDSGGLFPGIKLISGEESREGDPEYGISRGRLMPRHEVIGADRVSEETRRKLQDSLVLVHGGMAQNVGPILEMVTEKYLLRLGKEWQGRMEAIAVLERILSGLKSGDIAAVGEATTHNFFGPLQTIIPWSSNAYTETLIKKVRAQFAEDFLGFWMLGGMAGGGMGFIFRPERKAEAQIALLEIMGETKKEFETSLPFAMEPVVYDFAINPHGTMATLLTAEGDQGDASTSPRKDEGHASGSSTANAEGLGKLLDANGFDRTLHEQIRQDMKSGKIGLARNRLSAETRIEDVRDGDVTDARGQIAKAAVALGEEALRAGEVAIVTLAAGVGSRWTQGAGVVKGLHPYCKFHGHHRTFIETHLAKSRKTSAQFARVIPHIITTSHLTHGPIASFLARVDNHGYPGNAIHLSPGRNIGLRMVPMERDLRFAWEETSHQTLDEQKQKVRDSLHTALIQWAKSTGEASDYTDNLPAQCLHPVGHWFELPNLILNGTLRDLLRTQPELKTLMLHNIDTLGANCDPGLLGLHRQCGGVLSFEVISRRIDDRGGGLARVDGSPRLVEGLALPREEDEFGLRYYNTLTTWIEIDPLLAAFGLNRAALSEPDTCIRTVREFSARIPTYLSLKDVKKRWGHGQEDIFPVAQFEKLWGDMSALAEMNSSFLVVPRLRGQQLKDQAQLDGWLRDGSADYVDSLCQWE